MTLIVGVLDKENDKVTLGADSCLSSGNTILPVTTHGKIVSNPPYIFGSTGLLRISTVLEACDFSSHQEELETTSHLRHFIATRFIQDLRSQFGTQGLVITPSDETACFGGSFLLLARNRLFAIDGVYGVQEISLYTALGSGRDYALGSLATAFFKTSKVKNSEKLILDALRATHKHHAYVRPPFHLYTCFQGSVVETCWEK